MGRPNAEARRWLVAAVVLAVLLGACAVLFLLATPVVGYGPAWIGHFFIEGNRPATFGHPLWSLRADFKMLSLALRGRMADEVTRIYGSPHPAPDAPRVDIPADVPVRDGRSHTDGAAQAQMS